MANVDLPRSPPRLLRLLKALASVMGRRESPRQRRWRLIAEHVRQGPTRA